MANVSPGAQALLAAAAVAGSRTRLALAGSAAGLTDPSAALEEALEAELLTLGPESVPDELSFRHPLVRAAIYDDLSPTRRSRLHLAFAELTSGSAAPAHRVAASTGADDALATELSILAEDEIAAGRLTAGIEHLLWGSQIGASRKIREAALLRAVECLGVAGDVPRACSLSEAVVACEDSPRRSFILAAVASFFHAGRGNWTVASDHADAARRAAELAPLPVSSYYATIAGANLAAVRGDWDALLAALERPRNDCSEAVVANRGHRRWELLEAEALLLAERLEEAERVLGDAASRSSSPGALRRRARGLRRAHPDAGARWRLCPQ